MPTVHLEFAGASMLALNAIIALMMFGVSLELRREDFARIVRAPKAPLIGMLIQFLLLPASACLLANLLPIDPQLALGMLLVATCPSGSFSNVMTWLARGNVAGVAPSKMMTRKGLDGRSTMRMRFGLRRIPAKPRRA